MGGKNQHQIELLVKGIGALTFQKVGLPVSAIHKGTLSYAHKIYTQVETGDL